MSGNGRLRLLAAVSSVAMPDGLAFVHGQEVLRVKAPAAWSERIAGQLREGIHTTTIDADRHLGRLAAELGALGWLSEDDKVAQAEPRLERQTGYLTLFGSDARGMVQRLRDATVCLLGSGGVGSVAAQHLAAAGVGTLVLIDHDVVREHNLNRQLAFGVADIGRPKVLALARRLTELAPDVRTLPVQRQVCSTDDLETPELADADVLLVGADYPADIDQIAWSWCTRNDTAFIRAAVGLERGYLGPLLAPAAGHCLWCFEEARVSALTAYEAELERAPLEPTPWSFGPTNTVIAAWAVHDIVQYLCGSRPVSYRTRCVVDFKAARFSLVDPFASIQLEPCSHNSARTAAEP